MQFLRLTSDVPPRLLASVKNGIGHRTRLAYRSSASDYLRDRAAGRPWRSLLPNHRMVVATIEGLDEVGRTRTVGRYEYHDGIFDDVDRQLVGFGVVALYDAEDPATAAQPPDPDACPPTLTRTWVLSGLSDDLAARAVDFYAGDPLAGHLPGVEIEQVAGLLTEEQLHAYRVVAGTPWREEIYLLGADGGRAPHPLRTTEFAQRVRRLQPSHGDQGAVFAYYGSESLAYDYEQAPDDPRILHQVLLDASPYGAAQRVATIAYPRRAGAPGICTEQQQLSVGLIRSTRTDIDQPGRYEVNIEIETARYALLDLEPGPIGRFTRDLLWAQADAAFAAPLAFFAAAPAPGGGPRARLLHRARKRYCDPGATVPLAIGEVGTVTLLRHVEQAVLPDDAVDAAFDGHMTAVMLGAEGHGTHEDGYWWAPGDASVYGPAATFYRVTAELAPGAGQETIEFDAHALLVTAVEDGFHNRIEGERLPGVRGVAHHRRERERLRGALRPARRRVRLRRSRAAARGGRCGTRCRCGRSRGVCRSGGRCHRGGRPRQSGGVPAGDRPVCPSRPRRLGAWRRPATKLGA